MEMVAVTGEVFLRNQALAHLPKCLEVLKKAAVIFFFFSFYESHFYMYVLFIFSLRIGDRYSEVVQNQNKTNIKLLEKIFLTF